jgi:flagellar motor switch/type III secretory pathway protein FliN
LPRARASRPFLAGATRWIKGHRRVVNVARLGAIWLSFDSIESEDDDVAGLDDDCALFIRHQGEAAQIKIDRALAAAVVNAILGTVTDAIVERELGRGERGVLAAVVTEVLRALGSPWRLSLRQGVPLARAEAIRLIVNARVEALGRTAPIRLEIPRRWNETTDAAAHEQAATLVTVAGVELGATKLPAREWLAVQAGDGVVFDGLPALHAGGQWAVRLRVGAHAAAATLDADGAIRLLDGFRALPIASGRFLRKNEGSMDENSKAAGNAVVDPTLVLAAAPVEIVAELGRLVVRGDEILSLARGGVLAFAGPRATAVTLRVGDEIWARGELVDVDGDLGVRITQVTNDPTSRRG